MGYDYSLAHLAKYHELVEVLMRIAQTGEVLPYESDQWEKVRQRHQLVRSVLANMSRNMEGWEDIRTRIRTWTEHTPTGFRLLVGAPEHRVTGRPPAPASLDWKRKYVPAADAAAGGIMRWPTPIETGDDFYDLYKELPKVGETYHTIEFRSSHALNPEAIEGMKESFQSLNWTVSEFEGETVRLRRFTPSKVKL